MVNPGDKFNSLTYVCKFDIKSRRRHLFICDCGGYTFQRVYSVKHGNILTCGCQRYERDNLFFFKGLGLLSGNYFGKLKASAKKRNHEFNITLDEIWCMFLEQAAKCALSGIEIDLSKSYGRKKQTASLDRKDATKGYTIDNVQWVHKNINFMKQSMTNEEFINWCKLVSQYNEDKDVHSTITIDVNHCTK